MRGHILANEPIIDVSSFVRRSGGACNGLARQTELLLSLSALVICAPLFAISALLVRCSSPGPILFRQFRAGRNGMPFRLYKFRSMYANIRGGYTTMKGDLRITPVGRFLRSSKLDELPQLWNVVRGDMSLVGPRPEVPEYVDMTDPLWRELLKFRPGLTDPVTLNLINEEAIIAQHATDSEAFYLGTLQKYKMVGSLVYLHNRSRRSDIGIIVKTVKYLLSGSYPLQPGIDEIEMIASQAEIIRSRLSAIDL